MHLIEPAVAFYTTESLNSHDKNPVKGSVWYLYSSKAAGGVFFFFSNLLDCYCWGT